MFVLGCGSKEKSRRCLARQTSSAASYAATIDERPWSPLYERPATLGLLPDVKEKDVLDAGCGHGWYADWLAVLVRA